MRSQRETASPFVTPLVVFAFSLESVVFFSFFFLLLIEMFVSLYSLPKTSLDSRSQPSLPYNRNTRLKRRCHFDNPMFIVSFFFFLHRSFRLKRKGFAGSYLGFFPGLRVAVVNDVSTPWGSRVCDT